eukprot:10235868-Ditylum_brightwellii.AAC.1
MLCDSDNSMEGGVIMNEEKKEELFVWKCSRTNWNKICHSNPNDKNIKETPPIQQKQFLFAAKYVSVILNKDLKHQKKEAQNR